MYACVNLKCMHVLILSVCVLIVGVCACGVIMADGDNRAARHMEKGKEKGGFAGLDVVKKVVKALAHLGRVELPAPRAHQKQGTRAPSAALSASPGGGGRARVQAASRGGRSRGFARRAGCAGCWVLSAAAACSGSKEGGRARQLPAPSRVVGAPSQPYGEGGGPKMRRVGRASWPRVWPSEWLSGGGRGLVCQSSRTPWTCGPERSGEVAQLQLCRYENPARGGQVQTVAREPQVCPPAGAGVVRRGTSQPRPGARTARASAARRHHSCMHEARRGQRRTRGRGGPASSRAAAQPPKLFL